MCSTCMTWELAESGKHFIATIINGSDLVPTFSTASVDDLRSEVTSSSWYNDLLDQVEHTRVLNVFYRSATALGSRLPTMLVQERGLLVRVPFYVLFSAVHRGNFLIIKEILADQMRYHSRAIFRAMYLQCLQPKNNLFG
ncbi:hypothetical protein AgCh_012578 [Apium graveolens]